MTTAPLATDALISTREDDDPETPSESHEEENYAQNPPRPTEIPSGPSTGTPPALASPRRASTDDTYISTVSRLLARKYLIICETAAY
jgi:hypothetical protein